MKFSKSLLRETRGTTTIEYGAICGMIVLAILAAIRGLGDENGGQWAILQSKASTAMIGSAS